MSIDRRALLGRLGLGAFGAVAAVGIAQAQPEPLPPRRFERVPPRPRPGLVWRPGHWRWTGGGYNWVGGEYQSRRAGRWADGRWMRRGPNWVWVEPRWY